MISKAISSLGRASMKFGAWSMVISGIGSIAGAFLVGVLTAPLGEPMLFALAGAMLISGAILAAGGIKELRLMKAAAEDML